MIPENLPDYVERGGRQVWRPPYTASGVRKDTASGATESSGAKLFGFVLDAEPTAIDELLERDFNEPAYGGVDYRCAHSSVIVIFAEIDRLASDDPRDERRGYLSEREVSVWCLAADVTAGNRLVWYLPYVFVDAGQAVASGREVYGYPKQIGFFEDEYPDKLENGGKTTVWAPAIDHFGTNAKAIPLPMLSADHQPAGGPAPADKFSKLRELFTTRLDISERAPFGPAPRPSGAITPVGVPPPGRATASTVPAWAGRRVLDTLLGRGQIESADTLIAELIENPTLVFLKQFRDVSCPTKACYQAIVEAPLAIHLSTASYEALDEQAFTLEVADWDSHPIASDLGLQPGGLSPELAFRAEFEFDIQLGLEVWRAPT
jgi:hypothetical protein